MSQKNNQSSGRTGLAAVVIASGCCSLAMAAGRRMPARARYGRIAQSSIRRDRTLPKSVHGVPAHRFRPRSVANLRNGALIVISAKGRAADKNFVSSNNK